MNVGFQWQVCPKMTSEVISDSEHLIFWGVCPQTPLVLHAYAHMCMLCRLNTFLPVVAGPIKYCFLHGPGTWTKYTYTDYNPGATSSSTLSVCHHTSPIYVMKLNPIPPFLWCRHLELETTAHPSSGQADLDALYTCMYRREIGVKF